MQRQKRTISEEPSAQVVERLRTHLRQQLLGVLATQGASSPYTSLLAFAASATLDRLYFATNRLSRKYDNIAANPRVAMLIDNRTNESADFQRALAVTVLGEAREIPEHGRKTPLALFLQRHPALEPFCALPSTALMEIPIRRYILVTQFEEVRSIGIEDIVRQA